MLTLQHRSARSEQSTQTGFTLIEILVSLAILALTAGAIAGAFGITFKALAPGASKDRLASSNDLSVLEQMIGRDGARAACITAPDLSTGTYHVYGQTAPRSNPTNNGTCNTQTGYGDNGNASIPALLSACTSAPYDTLCFGWPQVSDSSCHVAVYTSASPQPPATPAPAGNVMITRTEYKVPTIGSPTASSVEVDYFDTVHSPWVQGAAPSAYTPPNETYLWLRSLQLTVIGTGVSVNQPQQTMVIHPLAVDPSTVASAILSTGSPC